jgi:hypothetical protein
MPAASRLPRPLTGILIALAALAALCLLGWAALAIFLPPAKLRAMLQAEAAKNLSRETRFGDVALGILPPVRLTVRDAAIAEPGGFNEGAALSARSMHLDLDVFALLARRVVVRQLTLDRPVLHYVIREDGSTNFDDLGVKPAPGGAAAPAGGQALDLAISDFRINEGEVLIDDFKARKRTMVDIGTRLSLTAGANGRIATRGATTLSGYASGPLSARRREDLPAGLAAIEWQIEHDGVFDGAQKRLALTKLGLGFGRTELAFQGIVDDPGPHARLDLKASGRDLDLAEVLKILSEADARALNGISGSGKVAFDLGIRGALGGERLPDLTGTLTLADGAFRYAGAEAGVEGLTFNARFAPDSLTVENLVARVAARQGDAAPVQARLQIWRFTNPQVRFAIAGDIDLAAISPMLAEQKTKLAGRARIDVRGAGPAKDPGAMTLDGTGRLSDVSVESPDLPQRIQRVNGSFRASQSVVQVDGLTAEAGTSSFTLDGRVERPLALTASTKPANGKPPIAPAIVRFALTSPRLDLKELLPATPGSPLLPNARGSGTVRIAQLKQDRLDVKNVAADLTLEPGVMTVPSFTFDGYGGAVAGKARFDLNDPAKPVFALSAKVNDVSADDILSAWTPARGLLHGTLGTSIELSGEGVTASDLARSLTAVGLAAIANGTLGPGPVLESLAEFTRIPQFKELRVRDGSFPFAVEQGRVRFREVRFDGPTGEWRVAGSVGFDGSIDYAVSATLPGEIANQLGTAGAVVAGALKDPDGQLLLDLRVTGTAKSPRVSWDKSAMMDRLMGRRSQALVEMGEKLGEDALEALGARGGGVSDTSLADYEARIRAVADSLKKLKARDVLKNLFGGGKKDTIW